MVFVCVLARQAALICPNRCDVIHLFLCPGVAMTDGVILNNHLIWSGAHELKPKDIKEHHSEKPSATTRSGDLPTFFPLSVFKITIIKPEMSVCFVGEIFRFIK